MPNNTTTKLWFYLGKRDKRGIRLLTTLRGREQLPIRIADISVLNLPTSWQIEINELIYDSRLLWEPWIESADTFDELRESLKLRGYSSIPISPIPEFVGTNLITTPEVNVSYLTKVKTMLRKA